MDLATAIRERATAGRCALAAPARSLTVASRDGGVALSAFATTQWALVLAAREDAAGGAALAALCAMYRAPVLAYVRRAGYSLADAEDLTQAFFVRFLERRADHAADPARGRFRQLLRMQLRHFLYDTQQTAAAGKRSAAVLGTDALSALCDPTLPPEAMFDRDFALSVIDRAVHALGQQMQPGAQREIYAALAPVLFEPRDSGALKVMAQAHGMRANTLAVSLKRLRDRLAALIRIEVAQLLADPQQLDEEVRALRAALRTGE